MTKKAKMSLRLLILLLGAAFLAWGYFIEPQMLTVTRFSMALPEWKDPSHQIKIVLAGDFHAAPGDHERMKRIVNRIRKENPDVILLLGDYCKGHLEETTMPFEEIGELLAPLTQSTPVFAVIGNHDEACGKRKTVQALEKAGIAVLEEKSVLQKIQGLTVQFAGLPDINTQPGLGAEDIPPRESSDIPYILLSHSPDVMPFVPKDKVDLTVAGHTHGGQICLPGGFPVKTSSQYGLKYAYGLMEDEGKPLLVTRGLGTSLFPFRFFCIPEIIVLTLQGQE